MTLNGSSPSPAPSLANQPAKPVPAEKRNAQRTRQRILRAAVAEFSVKGYDGARIDTIARRARANKRMIYHYFGNKSALFVAVLEHTYDDIRSKEAALHIENLPPVEGMRQLIAFSFGYYTENPSFIHLLNSENLHKARHLKTSHRVPETHGPLVTMLSALLRRGADAGVFRRDVDPVQLYISIAALGYFYFSNIHTLSTVFARDFASPDAREARLNAITDMVLGYLRP